MVAIQGPDGVLWVAAYVQACSVWMVFYYATVEWEYSDAQILPGGGIGVASVLEILVTIQSSVIEGCHRESTMQKRGGKVPRALEFWEDLEEIDWLAQPTTVNSLSLSTFLR